MTGIAVAVVLVAVLWARRRKARQRRAVATMAATINGYAPAPRVDMRVSRWFKGHGGSM